MKIKHINIRNNPILGNITMNFMKSDGTVSDTILFIGENGSGKSTLLNIIYDFCNLDNPKLHENESRVFIVDMNHSDFGKGEYTFLFNKNFHNREYDKSSWLNNMSITKDSQNISIASFISSGITKKVLKGIFSDVSINFNTKEIKSITNLNTDENVEKSIKSGAETAQDIKQLFVDIIIKDGLDLTTRVEENDRIAPPKEVQHVRLDRFKNAFNYMFNDEGLEFVGVDGLTPIFKKNGGQNILIDNLSSGEKQIVYRGGFLLKDRNSLSDSIILIDEPEISMHPIRQEKILDFYKNLFRYEDQSIISQIFVTTHSPYILGSMDYQNDKIFTFPGGVEVNDIKKYLGAKPSLALLNYIVFNIPTTDLFVELLGYIQEKTGKRNLSDIDEQFRQWGFEQNNVRTEYNKDKKGPEDKNYTIFIFIRNSIHHPENPYDNRLYTKQELRESIESMLNLIRKYSI